MRKSTNRKLKGSKLDIALAVRHLRSFTEEDIAEAFGMTRQGLGNLYREELKKRGIINREALKEKNK